MAQFSSNLSILQSITFNYLKKDYELFENLENMCKEENINRKFCVLFL